MENKTCDVNEKFESKNIESNFLKDNSNSKVDQNNDNNENFLIDNFKKATLQKSYEKSNTKKHYKLRDLDLLNTKNDLQIKKENPHIIKILNENIFAQNNIFEEYSVYLDKTYKTTTPSNQKNQSNKNISFITKESKLVNTIKLQDLICNTEEGNNHNILHTVGIQCSQISNRKGNFSKLKQMKTYNKNMDYYKYKYEINKKHMLNSEFNIKKKFENISDNSKINISQLLNMCPGRQIEEQSEGKIKVFQDFIENNKIYTKEELKTQEDLIKKHSLKLFAEESDTDINKLENTKSEQEDEFDTINIYNHLRFEHKKPQDYLLMLNKKTTTNQIQTPRGFGFNMGSLENMPRSKPFLNSNLIFNNKNHSGKNKFISEASIHREIKNDIFDKVSSSESKPSTIYHKMAQEEINLKLEKQRKDIKNLLISNNKNYLNNKDTSEKDYSNILDTNKSILSKNKTELKKGQIDNISFEKNRDFVKQNDERKKLKENKNLETLSSDLKSEIYSQKLAEESEISNILPSIYTKRMSENREQDLKKINKTNNSYKHLLNPRLNNNFSEDKIFNDNRHLPPNSTKNSNQNDQKYNILEIDTYKLENLSEKIYENKDVHQRDFSSRYIDHMKNNIFNIANIEIFSKYSYNNNNKLIKPFTPEKEIFEIHHQKSLNSNTIVIKDDIDIEEKTKKSNLKNTSEKYQDISNTTNTYSTLNNYNNTCPTELNNSHTFISKENLDLNSSRLEKNEKIKNLNKIINMGKLQKLEDIKKQIDSGYSNMNLLEGKLMNKINDSTQDFRNKLNKIQEKYYSTYKNEWHNLTHS